MPVPSIYTEPALRAFVVRELGATATVLGWDESAWDVEEAVNDALLQYHGGAGTIGDATDVARLRVLARFAAWRAAVGGLAHKVSAAAGDQRMDLDKHFRQAGEMLALARSDASAYGVGGFAVTVGRLVHTQSPYEYVDPAYQVVP